MDALHIIAMTGEMVSQMSLSSHVGRGSSGHCFAGDLLMTATTSSADTGLKVACGTSAVNRLVVRQTDVRLTDRH